MTLLHIKFCVQIMWIIEIYFGIAGGEPCPGVNVGQLCYFFTPTKATFSMSEKNCQSFNGQIASITDENTQRQVTSLVGQSNGTSLWIGARRQEKAWTWIEGNQILSPQGCFLNDDPSDLDLPYRATVNGPVMPETCISACQDAGYTFAGTQYGFLCYCGDDYGKHGTTDKCDFECQNMTSPISKWCGGETQSLVYQIGGAYGVWGFNQPNNFEGNQRCGVIDKNLENKMADEPCGKSYSFICKIIGVSCSGSGYYNLRGECVFVSGSMNLNWFKAVEDCKSKSGSLLSLSNHQLHLDVGQLLTTLTSTTDRVWIGVTRGQWSWQTGDVFFYTNWAPETPNQDKDQCVQMTSFGMWEDTSCHLQQKALCQTVDYNGVLTSTVTTPKGGTTTRKTDVTNAPDGGTTKVSTKNPGATTIISSSSSPSLTTTNQNSPNGSKPDTGASSTAGKGLLDWQKYVIIVIAVIILLLLFAIAGFLVYLCHRKNSKKAKVSSLYITESDDTSKGGYDARPMAHIPNGGLTSAYMDDKYGPDFDQS